MSDELISTALFDDPDPEGTDKYGMLPLVMEMPDDEQDDEHGDKRDDNSGADKRGGGEKDGDDDQEEALIEPSSLEIEVPEGEELPDEDNGAFQALTARGANDLSPGEAEDLINYMRPMSEEELAFHEESALNRDIERVDDPAHTDDVLRAGKGDHGVDKYLRDATYGDDMKDPDERAELEGSDETQGWGRSYPMFSQRSGRGYGGYGDGRRGDGDGERGHRRRHHRKHRHHGQPGQPGYGLQPGQPGYGLQPGQPGYVAPLPGQPGYGLQPGQPGYVAPLPGQPGYVAPQPGQPGYVDPSIAAQVAEYNAQHGVVSPPTTATSQYYPGTTTPIAQQYYPGTTTPIPQQYYPGTTTPIPQQYYPGTTTPIPATLPYPQQSTVPTYVPGSSQDPTSDANYIMGRDRAKVSMVRGLGHKLVVEHANWLADHDQAAGIAVRPRSYYENVGKLWAASKLKGAKFPMSTTMGDWTPKHRDFVVTANGLLAETAGQRKRFSVALGVDVDMGGWSPWGAVKSAVKTAAKYTVEKPLQYGYKYGKMAVTKPIEYTYKGVKYVGKVAERLALAPIRAIINRFANTMITRRMNALAKQRGLPTPTSVEKLDARKWVKNLVRAKGGKFGSVIASLMGSEYGTMPVDISLGDSFGGNDMMGMGKAGVAGLILLGPVGLIALLTGLVKLSGPAAPAPAPGSPEAAAEAAQAAQDAAAQDDGTDPSATPDDGSATADAATPDDGTPTDSSGYYTGKLTRQLGRPTVSIEQLSAMSPKRRKLVQISIKSGRIRLA